MGTTWMTLKQLAEQVLEAAAEAEIEASELLQKKQFYKQSCCYYEGLKELRMQEGTGTRFTEPKQVYETVKRVIRDLTTAKEPEQEQPLGDDVDHVDHVEGIAKPAPDCQSD